MKKEILKLKGIQEIIYNNRSGDSMSYKRDEISNKINVDADQIKKEFGIDLFLFLDAVSLGLNDNEIADLIGYDIEKIRKVRKRLGNVSSKIGINYKKNLPPR